MFLIKGRLLGTFLGLLIAAGGAMLLAGGSEPGDEPAGGALAPVAAMAAR